MKALLSGTPGRGLWHVAIALVVLGMATESADASAGSPGDFCAPKVAHDYLAPLDGVPLTSRFPSSGEIGVGPESLRIFVRQGQLVPIGKGLLGARGSVLSRRGQAQSLNWTITSQLEKIGKRKLSKVVRRKTQSVKKVANFNQRQFGFSSQGISAGLYRLTVEIENADGRVLERHQEAFRALRPESDLRLTKSFDSLAPGESGLVRIDNYGTVEATFGPNYRLWSSAGEEVPMNPIFGNVLYRLPAGLAGPCWTFTVPENLAPGVYKIGSVASDLIRRNQLLTSSFSVR